MTVESRGPGIAKTTQRSATTKKVARQRLGSAVTQSRYKRWLREHGEWHELDRIKREEHWDIVRRGAGPETAFLNVVEDRLRSFGFATEREVAVPNGGRLDLRAIQRYKVWLIEGKAGKDGWRKAIGQILSYSIFLKDHETSSFIACPHAPPIGIAMVLEHYRIGLINAESAFEVDWEHDFRDQLTDWNGPWNPIYSPRGIVLPGEEEDESE